MSGRHTKVVIVITGFRVQNFTDMTNAVTTMPSHLYNLIQYILTYN